MVAAGLVHAAYLTTPVPGIAKGSLQIPAGSETPPTGRQIVSGNATADVSTTLPPAVSGMRDAILEAVQSGRLEDLKAAFDLNELKPELAADPVSDPIAFWRATSSDGEGRTVLDALSILLDLPHIILPLGKDPENPGLYIWPAFADRPLHSLTAAEDADLIKLEAAPRAATMKAGGRYTGWRLVIGADGVWHSFRRYD